jgi:DNA-binding XRE family transcriptional regulator
MKKTGQPATRAQPRTVGDLIAQQRRLLGISTYTFARGCHCSEATIRHIESGRYAPSLSTCIRIADFLKMPRAQIARLGGYALERAEAALDAAEAAQTGNEFQELLEADPALWQSLMEVLPALSKDSRERALQYIKFLQSEEQRGKHK